MWNKKIEEYKYTIGTNDKVMEKKKQYSWKKLLLYVKSYSINVTKWICAIKMKKKKQAPHEKHPYINMNDLIWKYMNGDKNIGYIIEGYWVLSLCIAEMILSQFSATRAQYAVNGGGGGYVCFLIKIYYEYINNDMNFCN